MSIPKSTNKIRLLDQKNTQFFSHLVSYIFHPFAHISPRPQSHQFYHSHTCLISSRTTQPSLHASFLGFSRLHASSAGRSLDTLKKLMWRKRDLKKLFSFFPWPDIRNAVANNSNICDLEKNEHQLLVVSSCFHPTTGPLHTKWPPWHPQGPLTGHCPGSLHIALKFKGAFGWFVIPDGWILPLFNHRGRDDVIVEVMK